MISDIGLPDRSGYELMQELSASKGLRGIALSGFGMENDVNRARAAGFSEHLTKPINFERLEEVDPQPAGAGAGGWLLDRDLTTVRFAPTAWLRVPPPACPTLPSVLAKVSPLAGA